MGIGLATIVSIVVVQLMDAPNLFDPMSNVATFVFSVTIGMMFRFSPARRVARMNPIEALSHE